VRKETGGKKNDDAQLLAASKNSMPFASVGRRLNLQSLKEFQATGW